MGLASKYLLASFSALVFLSPVTQASKTLTLDLIEEVTALEPRLLRRDSGDGWRSTDLIYNTTSNGYGGFYISVNIGDKGKVFKLQVNQTPITFIGRKWNRTRDCSPVVDVTACDNGKKSGLFSFNPPDSGSIKNLTGSLDISFLDKRYALGVWARDTFGLGQFTVEDVNFGIADRYNITPTLGLSDSASDTPYSTFLEVMRDQGIINTPTYGVYVGDLRGSFDSGKSITFGGIDSAKFDKPLKVYNSSTGYYVNIVQVNAISGGSVVATGFDQTGTRGEVAELNFGSQAIWVPQDVLDTVMTALGASPDQDGYYYLQDLPPDDIGVEFVFQDNLKIYVPLRQMVTPSVYGSWFILMVTGPEYLFGTPFFRAAYVFYDFQNSQIGIAPSKYNATGSNVTAVGVDDASVEALSWLLEDPNATSTSTSTMPPTATGTMTGPTSTTAGSNPNSGSKTNVAAIAGGAAGGGVLLIAALIFLIWWCRKPKPMAPAPEPMPPPNSIPPTPMMDKGAGVVFSNEQFSPTKPSYNFGTQPPVPPAVISPVAELDPYSSRPIAGHSQIENVAAPHRYAPTSAVHEMG